MAKSRTTAFFARNVDMSLQNGQGSVRHAKRGIHLLKSRW